MALKGQAVTRVDAPPGQAFDVITDLARLVEWNERMTGVVELPPALTEGAQWVVSFKTMGKRFTSRSTVIELDRAGHRFVYRSKREDDNPSFTIWTWTVEPEGASGSWVTLAWEMRPATLVRRRMVGPLRSRQIANREAPASLAAFARRCAA